MKKIWRNIGLGAVIAFLGMQLVTCERVNGPSKADLRASAEVKAVLTRACYDCHSSETTWPWYSRIAPISWLVHRDVTEGRAALNFSDWEALPSDKRAKLQRESGGTVLEAKRLLAHTNQTVAAISEELGFSEPTNFVKFFRSRGGLLPGAFRERLGSA